MSIDSEQVKKIAQLAQIAVDDAQLQELKQSLTQIIDLVGVMQQVNTDNTEAMAHPIQEATQRLREDVVSATNRREQLQKIAPQIIDGLFVVPKVIE